MYTNPIRLLLVEDHAPTHYGLQALINKQADMQVVAEAWNGVEGVAAYRVHRPNVVLMDGRLPRSNGVEASRAILAEFPDARILLLSFTEEMFALAREVGVKACLLKEAPTSRLLELIRRIHLGEVIAGDTVTYTYRWKQEGD